MKRDDLFTKLHDQYNVVPSSLQDPEAFHHDVYEISNEASSADEFHRMMAQRKEERMMELNDLLESTALQIISNPDLITSDQWEFAVQLFRTKSFDSLVRYFASYLPGDWHHSHSDTSGSDSDSVSDDSIADSQQSGPSFFDDKPLMAEPNAMQSYLSTHLPPSPRSMTMCSDDSAAVDLVHHKYVLTTLTPARTLSCSGSEPEHFSHHDDASQTSDPETPVSSISDISETHRHELLKEPEAGAHPMKDFMGRDEPTPQTTDEPFTSETPTPKPESHMTCFLEANLSPLSSSSSHHHHRSLSPSRAYPLVHATYSDSRKSSRIQRRDVSPPGRGSRRGNCRLDETSRICKPSTERSRFRGRRVIEEDDR